MSRVKRIAMMVALLPVLMIPTQASANEDAATTTAVTPNPIYNTMRWLTCDADYYLFFCRG